MRDTEPVRQKAPMDSESGWRRHRRARKSGGRMTAELASFSPLCIALGDGPVLSRRWYTTVRGAESLPI